MLQSKLIITKSTTINLNAYNGSNMQVKEQYTLDILHCNKGPFINDVRKEWSISTTALEFPISGTQSSELRLLSSPLWIVDIRNSIFLPTFFFFFVVILQFIETQSVYCLYLQNSWNFLIKFGSSDSKFE